MNWLLSRRRHQQYQGKNTTAEKEQPARRNCAVKGGMMMGTDEGHDRKAGFHPYPVAGDNVKNCDSGKVDPGYRFNRSTSLTSKVLDRTKENVDSQNSLP